MKTQIQLMLALFLFFKNAIGIPNGDQYTKFLGVKLEDSKIEDVVNSFGETKILISGNAADYSKRLNYYFEAEKAYVTFDVCEMGGDSTITLFHIQSKMPNESFKKVPATKFKKGDIGGFYIGMERKDFCKILNLTRKCGQDSASKYFIDSIPMTPSEIKRTGIPAGERAMWDVGISVMGKFENQKLSDLYINKNTTN